MSLNGSTPELDTQLDDDIEQYLNIALANGFSKGTANVSPGDMKKLKGLLKHYAKKKHPFRSCVRDNRKRFGNRTEAVCAVLKDLIRGTTKWRSTERKKHMSEEELRAEFLLSDFPDNYILDFVDWAINLDDETVNIILTANNDDESEDMSLDLEAGDVAWSSSGSLSDIRKQIESHLNDGMGDGYGMTYWVEDVKNGEALVCERGEDYYVVPFDVSKKGTVELGDEDEWKLVERAWVESNVNMSANQEYVAELFFEDSGNEVDNDGLIWKTFMREGTWAYSPEKGRAVKVPLTITKSGKSDPSKKIISMADVKKNFEVGAIQHVTVPLSHDDKTEDNTGFVKKLRYGKDEKGRTTLEAAIDFTEPDIKEKIERGTIPNVSAGIHFNYIDKESGKKFDSVMGHLALTPKPWLGGMAPFGVKASENLTVVGFSEQLQTSDTTDLGGGVEDNMTTIVETPVEETEDTDTFLTELGLSEEGLKDKLARLAELEREGRERSISDQVKAWEEAKKSPALITQAKAILMADEGDTVLTLSEDGNSVGLSASDIVNRLMEAAPALALADDPVTEEEAMGERAPDDATEENLSEEVKSEANRLFLYERYSEDDALAEAKRRFAEKTTA